MFGVSLKKSIRELKESGGWEHLSKREQARRISQEAVAHVMGVPQRPPNLSPREKKLWAYYTKGLLQKRVLAMDDADLLMKLIESKLLDDVAAQREVVKEFAARTPFPEEPDAEPEQIVEAPPAPDATETATRYAQDVLDGKIIAGRLVHLACKRFLADLKRDDLFYDPVAAQHFLNFAWDMLGVQLLPFQVFITSNLFGFKRLDGLRRFTTALVLLAKKNGKSTLSACIGLYMFLPAFLGGDDEPNATTYCAATTKYQSSSIVFKMAAALREKSPEIAGATRKWRYAITMPNGNLFEPLCGVGASSKLNGLSIHCGLLDEVSDHADASLANCFTSSTAGRLQSLILAISTAGETQIGSICFEHRARAIQILENVLPGDGSDSYFAYIAELDEGDAAKIDTDENLWWKSNPGLDVLVPRQGIRDLAAQSRAIPSTRHAFLRFSHNVWSTSSITKWINVDDLAAPGVAYISEAEKLWTPGQRITAAEERLAVKPLDPKKDSLAQMLAARRCFPGLDLALVNDLSALCLLFPPKEPDGIFECIYRFWCPEENIERRTREQRVPYQAWADSTPPHIITTPGETTDFSFIKGEILALRNKFRMIELGFDRSLAEDLCKSLEIAGMKVTQVTQGFGLSAALQRVEKLIIDHKLCIHGHPIAHWNFSNVLLTHGYRGDVRVEKGKSREKVDGAVACAIAMQIYMSQPATRDGADAYKVRMI